MVKTAKCICLIYVGISLYFITAVSTLIKHKCNRTKLGEKILTKLKLQISILYSVHIWLVPTFTSSNWEDWSLIKPIAVMQSTFASRSFFTCVHMGAYHMCTYRILNFFLCLLKEQDFLTRFCCYKWWFLHLFSIDMYTYLLSHLQ